MFLVYLCIYTFILRVLILLLLYSYKEIILLGLTLPLATENSSFPFAFFSSISSEESNEWNDCSTDCCTAAHVH